MWRIYAAFTAADTVHAAGDERSKNQVMADTLIARVTGEEEAGEIDIEIQLVITDEALLGDSNTPARINNHGPIPAPIARGLAAEAIGNNRAWVHRLYVRPDSGQLVAMESARRHFPKTMKAFIKTRDEVCRTPWCGAPIRHIDHLTPAHAGGTTSLATAKACANAATNSNSTPAGNTPPNPTAPARSEHPPATSTTAEPPTCPTNRPSYHSLSICDSPDPQPD